MSEIEVIEVVLKQIGDIRLPVRETEVRAQLEVIAGNLIALKEAIENATKQEDKQEQEVTEDV